MSWTSRLLPNDKGDFCRGVGTGTRFKWSSPDGLISLLKLSARADGAALKTFEIFADSEEAELPDFEDVGISLLDREAGRWSVEALGQVRGIDDLVSGEHTALMTGDRPVDGEWSWSGGVNPRAVTFR